MPRSSLIVSVALVATIVVLVLSGFVGYGAAQAAVATSAAMARNKDTLLSLERVLSGVRDAETGQRGYLLTGIENYLEPYDRALLELPPRLSQLRESVSADALTRQQLADLQRLIASKLDELARTVALNRSGNHAQAIALVMSDEGRRLMIDIAADVAALETNQTRIFQAQMNDLSSARVRAAASLIAVRVLTITLVITLVLVVRRDTRRLRLSEQRLSITLRSIGDGVIATDPDGRIVMLNTVAEQLTGWSSAGAIGTPFDQVFRIVNEQTHATVENPIARVLREGRIVGLANHTLLIRRDGSETPIEDSAAPIRDHAGAVVGVVLVFRDGSSEREIARALREADRKKDEFIAVLAHELRNPLAPILQAVQIARAAASSPQQLRWSLDVVERQGRTMGRLLDDLLDVSRITRGTVQVMKSNVTLAEVIERAVETARPSMQARQHTLLLDTPAERVMIDVDPVRIAQVIANLLTNAAKYTSIGGVIRLTASCDAAQLTLSVSDNGIGIDREALPRVFDMFVQVKEALDREEGGLGIGLAVSKRLVELHQGSLEARSEGTGRGSEFIVRIPCVLPEQCEPIDSSAASMPTPASPGLRIVIADDNRDAADSLAMLLQMDGHEVQVAHDGSEALDLIRRTRPSAALLDIGMPGMNGYQVAEGVRADAATARIMLVAVTGWGQAQDLERARVAGFDHHLIKPAEPQAVRSLLQRLTVELAAS
jgi:PAS domain S-box-containing protein